MTVCNSHTSLENSIHIFLFKINILILARVTKEMAKMQPTGDKQILQIRYDGSSKLRKKKKKTASAGDFNEIISNF